MIQMTTKQQIILQHIEGKSNRAIAKLVGVDKNTVNKYVNEYDGQLRELMKANPDQDPSELIEAILQKPTYDSSSRQPSAKTKEAMEVIRQCLEKNKWKIEHGMSKQVQRASDIHRYLNEDLGIRISYSTVKKIVHDCKEATAHYEAFIRQEPKPGISCEFDWGEVKLNIGKTGYHKYQMAAFASSYGNYRFGILFRCQDTAAFQEAHAKFFHFCKGVYHTVVYDNMKVAVKRFVGPTEKEPTDALVELSTYYHFNFRFCNVRRGNEKSHVERSVDVLRHEAFTALGDDEFDTLEAANQHLLKKCIKLNNEPLSDGRIPMNTFIEEKPYLMAELPEMPCFVKRTNCQVDKYSTICVNKVHYSVPDIYAEKTVDARIYTDKIVAYDNDKIIARHQRSYECGSYHIDIFHYLKTLKRKPGALPQSTALLQADVRIKNTYERYYSDKSKDFLDILEIINEKGIEPVEQGIEKLLSVSPGDLSAAKIRIMMNTNSALPDNHEGAAEDDPLCSKILDTLSQYDRLREAMNT